MAPTSTDSADHAVQFIVKIILCVLYLIAIVFIAVLVCDHIVK